MSYTTDNIAIASALKHLGHTIENIEVEGRKAMFFFNDEVISTVMSIEMGQIKVDPLQFHQDLRRLSSLARTMANKG